MTSHNTATIILDSYPQLSPWELDPPIHNLRPRSDPAEQFDTPQLKAAALDIAKSTWMNVFARTLGSNPLWVANRDLREGEIPTPIVSYQRPLPLTPITLPDSVAFLRQINPTGNTTLFLIRTGDDTRILKVYPDGPPRRRSSRHVREHGLPPDPRLLFANEKEAYAHLVHYGACDKGVVPRCYGWCELSRSHVEAIVRLQETSDDAKSLSEDERLPKALLLEYLPDAQNVTIDNVTIDIGDKALRALHAVHACYVFHGDIHGRNVLLLADGRVVWIDFDSAECESSGKLSRAKLLDELSLAWGYFYSHLIPNKRIGYRGGWK